MAVADTTPAQAPPVVDNTMEPLIVHTATAPVCKRGFHQPKAISFARDVYTRHLRVTRKSKRHLKEMIRCQHTPDARRNVRVKRREFRQWRRAGGAWKIRFYRLPAGEQAWARSTGSCESGNDPSTNTGNGFLGSHQFTPDTAVAAGFGPPSAMPGAVTQASWWEQAVRAVWWKWKTSDEQWPVCGD